MYMIRDGCTFFTLEPGTVFTLGSEEIVLAEQAEVCIGRIVPEEGVIDAVLSSDLRNLAANDKAVKPRSASEAVKPRSTALAEPAPAQKKAAKPRSASEAAKSPKTTGAKKKAKPSKKAQA